MVEQVGSIEEIWESSLVLRIIDKQQEDGSWKYPSSKKDLRTQENYDQIEIYRQLGFLIQKNGFIKNYVGIGNAAEYFYSK
ncbi:MAG: hypothetical protein ACFE9X_12710 [Promethearchaeota archaeon]